MAKFSISIQTTILMNFDLQNFLVDVTTSFSGTDLRRCFQFAHSFKVIQMKTLVSWKKIFQTNTWSASFHSYPVLNLSTSFQFSTHLIPHSIIRLLQFFFLFSSSSISHFLYLFLSFSSIFSRFHLNTQCKQTCTLHITQQAFHIRNHFQMVSKSPSHLGAVCFAMTKNSN